MKRMWLAILAAVPLGCASSGGGGGSSCTPGENRCFENYLGTCGNDGATWTLGFCGTERTCFEGQCRTQVCTPGRTTCEDPWNANECDTGLETRTVPCALGEKCYEAGCLPETCTLGQIRCLHDTRLTCAYPAGWVAVPCPGGQACKGDQCVPKVCTPREGVCIAHPDQPGREIGLLCGLNGTEWASQSPCSADQVCQEGFCFPKTPAPPPPTDTGPADARFDPGPEPPDPGPAEDLARPDDPGPRDLGPPEDLALPPGPNRATINDTPVAFTDFVKASLIAGGELMVALHSAPVDGVPFPDVLGRRQVVELRFPGIAAGATGTFRCEDGSVRLWYRFGKYEQGGECKDYDYHATHCVVTLTAFQADAGVVSGTFDQGALEDCLPGGPPVTIVDGHFHYEK